MSIPIETTAGPRPESPRDTWTAITRGLGQRCPSCGTGQLYSSYLKVCDACPACGTELHHQRADDAPPYFTMVVVAHVVIGGMLMLERSYAPDWIVHIAIWIPLTIGLSLWLLPRIKGALIGLQWALRMHGFGHGPDPAAPDVLPHEPRHTERGR